MSDALAHLLVAIDLRSKGVALRLRSDQPLELVLTTAAEAEAAVMEWLGREHRPGAQIEVRRGSTLIGTTGTIEVAEHMVRQALRGARPRSDP